MGDITPPSESPLARVAAASSDLFHNVMNHERQVWKDAASGKGSFGEYFEAGADLAIAAAVMTRPGLGKLAQGALGVTAVTQIARGLEGQANPNPLWLTGHGLGSFDSHLSQGTLRGLATGQPKNFYDQGGQLETKEPGMKWRLPGLTGLEDHKLQLHSTFSPGLLQKLNHHD